jgi:hypothetical protein
VRLLPSLLLCQPERRKAKNPVIKEAIEQAERGIKDANDPSCREAAIWQEAHRIIYKYYCSVAEQFLKKR